MKRISTFLLGLSLVASAFAQNNETGVSPDILPKGFTQSELQRLKLGAFERSQSRGIETPPPYDNLRNMAEWEEVQSLNISWTGYPDILKQIVQHAMDEVEVIILSENVSSTQSYLEDSGTGLGAITDFSNITILDAEYDSVWSRDYSGNAVYGNEVDDLIMVDWIYNRPNRPDDDASPEYIADHLGLDLYCMTEAPADLVNTGGNWMTNGFGQGFSSMLVLNENEPGNEYDVTAKTEEEIDDLVEEWLGVTEYVKMEPLPFDNINHIDMHMKLIDEQTLFVGQFPEGVSDGPQIQANMEYVLSNFTNKWGEPYKIVWLPMPPTTNGDYPNGSWNGPAYRTYTNSVFVNNTIIVPTYREEYDTTAMRIYEENLPGYNIVGIDCDDQPEPIIFASGAIHCITHSVGVEDPLLISHNSLPDTESTEDYLVNAYMNHRTGVTAGTMYWRLQGESDYQMVAMTNVGDNEWEAHIPGQPVGSTIEYYVHGEATNGKTQNRPMPAPEGYWEFDVVDELVNIEELQEVGMDAIYPNPCSSMTVIPLKSKLNGQVEITIIDVLGNQVMDVYAGQLAAGEKKFFFDAARLSAGTYVVQVRANDSIASQKIVVQ